jgi:hypothetical protein
LRIFSLGKGPSQIFDPGATSRYSFRALKLLISAKAHDERLWSQQEHRSPADGAGREHFDRPLRQKWSLKRITQGFADIDDILAQFGW